MKKKVISVVLAAMMGMTLFAGCGSNSANSEAPKAEASSGSAAATAAGTTASAATTASGEEEPVTLRFMWWGGDDRATATLDVIKQFEAKYPYITIEPEYGSSDGYQEKLTTQLSSGNGADIIQMGPGWLPGYISSNPDYFIDFNDYSDSIDLTTFDADFLKQNGNIDGHQYGIPTGIAGQAFIYNKTLADKIGLKFPDNKADMTWDKLLELGEQVQKYDSNMYLFTIDDNLLATNLMRPYLLQLTGKTAIVDDTKELGFTAADLTECLTYIKKLYDEKIIPPLSDIAAYGSGDALQTDPKWVSGDTYVGMFCPSSTVDVESSACPNCEFAAAYLPEMENAKDDGFYASCPQYMCIPKTSKHINEAILFLNYFYNDKEAAKTLKTVRSVPPTSVGQQVCADEGILEGLAKDSVDILQDNYHGTNEMGLTTEEECTEILKNMIAEVAYGQDTPENIAKNGMTLLQNYVDSNK